MNSKADLRHAVRCVFVFAVCVISWSTLTSEVLARGGGRQLRWGYQPPAGDPFRGFMFADPWAAMTGANIPRRNLGSPGLNMGSAGGGRSGGGSLPGRSTVFPGASSQASATPARRWTAPVYSQYFVSVPTAEYSPSADDFLPPYYHSHNDDWHHGYWGGGHWGWAEWDRDLGVWSFPRWEMGPWYYTSGYGRFHNPFVGDDPRLKAYAEVIEIEVEEPSGDRGEVATEASREPKIVDPDEAEGLKQFAAARDAFRQRDYALALAKVDLALESLLHDPAVHEFRGLVLMAQGEYRQASAVIYDVLAVSPGWDWITLSSLYADSEEYTRQLRALEKHRRENPDSPDVAFLVAYQYATCGHHAIAVRHLRNVMRLLPDDNLAPHLVTLFEAAIASAREETPDATAVAAAAADSAAARRQLLPIDPSTLTGTWRATRHGHILIELKFQGEKKFTWTVNDKDHVEKFEGEFISGGTRLILATEVGTMFGAVTPRSLGGGFNFRLLENAPLDPGLDFDR